jgi:hypothetical protein
VCLACGGPHKEPRCTTKQNSAVLQPDFSDTNPPKTTDVVEILSSDDENVEKIEFVQTVDPIIQTNDPTIQHAQIYKYYSQISGAKVQTPHVSAHVGFVALPPAPVPISAPISKVPPKLTSWIPGTFPAGNSQHKIVSKIATTHQLCNNDTWIKMFRENIALTYGQQKLNDHILPTTLYYRGTDNHLKTLSINPRLCHTQTNIFDHLFTQSSSLTKSSPEFIGLPAELEGYTVEMVLGYLHGYSFALTQPDKLNYYFVTACYFGLEGLKRKIKKSGCVEKNQSPDFDGMSDFAGTLAKPVSYGDGVCATVEDLPRFG